MCHPHEPTHTASDLPWHPDDKATPAPARPGLSQLFRPDVLETIEQKIGELDEELRALSLDIHGMVLHVGKRMHLNPLFSLDSSSGTGIQRIVRHP